VPQDAQAQRVERADRRPVLVEPPEVAQLPAQHVADALLHLAGRFIRERDGKDRRWRDALADEVGDAARDDRVFPEPAPATISSGPSTCCAASRCGSVRSSNNFDASITRRL
jgi:hypothetical protein